MGSWCSCTNTGACAVLQRGQGCFCHKLSRDSPSGPWYRETCAPGILRYVLFLIIGGFISEDEPEPAESSVELTTRCRLPGTAGERSLGRKTPGVKRGKGDFLLSQKCALGSKDDPGSTTRLSNAAGPSWSLTLREQLRGNSPRAAQTCPGWG